MSKFTTFSHTITLFHLFSLLFMGCSTSHAEPKYSIWEKLPQTPRNTKIFKLQKYFKISADFLFDSTALGGHQGLFSKGPVAGSSTWNGWLLNANNGILSIHGKGSCQGKLNISSTNWNRISIEQLDNNTFICSVNEHSESFVGTLGTSSSFPLKIGIQDTCNQFNVDI